ncbi:hypothetical protein [Nonomuraea sp. NPDC049784]|uniref:hypothetical protein n=1 Tax=Nonomuraea sp. NPDC049784 TaxID=3154361 RepID=UPI0033CA7704
MTARTGVDSPAASHAQTLAAHLRRYGIESKISECEGVALVGIWSVGLAVWCEWGQQGWHFRWCLDKTSERWTYTWCPCSAMETAVRRLVYFHQARQQRLSGTAPSIDGEGAS